MPGSARHIPPLRKRMVIMAKMWAGRFSKETDPGVNDFNSSIAFDARMYRVDIRGSMAHAGDAGEDGDYL